METSSTSESSVPVEIEANFDRKILHIHFRGIVTAPDMKAHVERMREVLLKIGPGFLLVTDLTSLEEMDVEAVRDITRTMDLCIDAGVKRVIRVIPDPDKDIGFHLLSITHYRGHVPIATFATLNEAKAAFDD
jgi:hypothetical protein